MSTAFNAIKFNLMVIYRCYKSQNAINTEPQIICELPFSYIL